MSRALLVHGFNAYLDILYSTSPTETHEPEKEAASADTLGFVWVDAAPAELVRGDIAAMAETNNVQPARVHGYWFGTRSPDGKHGQPAVPGEKVLYHLHGKHDLL